VCIFSLLITEIFSFPPRRDFVLGRVFSSDEIKKDFLLPFSMDREAESLMLSLPVPTLELIEPPPPFPLLIGSVEPPFLDLPFQRCLAFLFLLRATARCMSGPCFLFRLQAVSYSSFLPDGGMMMELVETNPLFLCTFASKRKRPFSFTACEGAFSTCVRSC